MGSKSSYKLPVFYVIAFIYLFLTMFVPDSYRVIRLGVLLVLFFLPFLKVDYFFIKFDKLGFFILFTYITFNFISSVHGMFVGAPGAFRVLTADILWPLLMFFIGIKISKQNDYDYMMKFIVYTGAIISIWDLWYCLGQLNLIAFPLLLNSVDLNYMFGSYGLFCQYSTTHMVSIIFSIPFTIAYLLNYKRNRKLFIIFLLIEFIVVLMSGRAALQCISFASLFYVPFFQMLVSRKKIKYVKFFFLLSAVGICLLLFVFSYLEDVVTYVRMKIINSINDTESVDSTRFFQVKYLFEGFFEHPFWGNGTGSYTTKVIRDIESPWNYEMFYHALLFQKGAIGFLLFISQIIYIFHRFFKKIKMKLLSERIAIPILVGLTSILIASIVDPYIYKLGCIWILYLPYALAITSRERKINVN